MSECRIVGMYATVRNAWGVGSDVVDTRLFLEDLVATRDDIGALCCVVLVERSVKSIGASRGRSGSWCPGRPLGWR